MFLISIKEMQFIMENNKSLTSLLKYDNYESKYDLIFSFNHSVLSQSICLLGTNPTSNTCIFCLRNEPEITLDCRSHAIPTFLGNKYLYNRLECKECNNNFGRNIETQLDIFTKPYRLFNGIKIRKKGNYTFLKYQSSSQKFLVHNLMIGNIVALGVSGKNISEFILKENDSNMVLNFEEKCRPSDVYKCFMKIIYGLLPEKHHSSFTLLREWIMDEDPENLILNNLTIYQTITPNPIKDNLSIYISKRKYIYGKDQKSQEYYEFTAHINFGNVFFDIPLLSDSTLNYLKNRSENIILKFDLFTSLLPIERATRVVHNFADARKIKDINSFYFSNNN